MVLYFKLINRKNKFTLLIYGFAHSLDLVQEMYASALSHVPYGEGYSEKL